MDTATILVIDDNELNLKLVSLMLGTAGYTICTAGDATEALTVLGTVHPHLILMDLHLPGVDGLELTRQLKAAAATRDILIVALTASAMSGDEECALAAGCDGYIAKPIDTRRLLAIVGDYLARAEPRYDEMERETKIAWYPDRS